MPSHFPVFLLHVWPQAPVCFPGFGPVHFFSVAFITDGDIGLAPSDVAVKWRMRRRRRYTPTMVDSSKLL